MGAKSLGGGDRPCRVTAGSQASPSRPSLPASRPQPLSGERHGPWWSLELRGGARAQRRMLWARDACRAATPEEPGRSGHCGLVRPTWQWPWRTRRAPAWPGVPSGACGHGRARVPPPSQRKQARDPSIALDPPQAPSERRERWTPRQTGRPTLRLFLSRAAMRGSLLLAAHGGLRGDREGPAGRGREPCSPPAGVERSPDAGLSGRHPPHGRHWGPARDARRPLAKALWAGPTAAWLEGLPSLPKPVATQATCPADRGRSSGRLHRREGRMPRLTRAETPGPVSSAAGAPRPRWPAPLVPGAPPLLSGCPAVPVDQGPTSACLCADPSLPAQMLGWLLLGGSPCPALPIQSASLPWKTGRDARRRAPEDVAPPPHATAPRRTSRAATGQGKWSRFAISFQSAYLIKVNELLIW